MTGRTALTTGRTPLTRRTPVTRRAARFVALAAALALAATGLTLLAGCAALQRSVVYPDATIRGVDVDGISFTTLTLRFDVEVKNPYDVDLPVVGLDYDLSTEGKRFASGSLGLDQRIPAGESRVVGMPVRIPFLELREAVKGIGFGDTVPYEADLGLRIEAPLIGSISIPLKEEGTLEIPSLP